MLIVMLMSKRQSKRKKNILTADEEQLLAKFNQFRVTSSTEVPEVKYVFKVNGVGCMPLGDLAAIKARPKQGKSTAIKWIVATVFSGKAGQLESDLKDPYVLWVDTEQSMGDVKLIIEDVRKITGRSRKYLDQHLIVVSLRKTDSKTMEKEVKAAIKHYQPHVVVLDGLAEFADSVNDEKESKALVNSFMQASSEYNCAIICVLHENRAGTNDMKGHLGAQLNQKAAVILECKKNGDVITVTCTDPRHQKVPDWSIRFDGQGNIIDADGFTSPMIRNSRPSSKVNKKHQADVQERQNRLDFCITTIQAKGGSIAKNELIRLLMEKAGKSRTTISNLISEFIKKDKALVATNKKISLSSSEAVAA